MGDKTIVIGCPINDSRMWIAEHYLQHILNINYNKKLIHIYFLLNGKFSKIEKVLKQFKRQYEGEYASIKLDYYYKNVKAPEDDRTNVRIQHTYSHLSNMRNKILEYASSLNSTLFSCDSDILVPKDILHKLLDSNKKIISSLIFNGYLKDSTNPYKYPNILNFNPTTKTYEHISNFYVKNSPILAESKLLKVDFTGAVYVIDKEVLNNKNIRYAWHLQGEDTLFCESARNEGHDLWCDAGVFSYHIMNEKYLEMYLKDKTLLHKGVEV